MEIEKILSESWRIYKKNWVTFIIAQILVSAVSFISIVILLASLLISQSWQWTIIFIPLSILMILLSIGIESGIYYLAKKGSKRKVYTKTFLEGVRKYWMKFVGTKILISLIFLFASFPLIFFVLSKIEIGIFMWLGFLFLIAPLFSIAPAAIVFNKSVISSIKESVIIGYRNYLLILLVLFIYSIFHVILLFLDTVGILVGELVIVPLKTISFVLIYKYFKSKKYLS